MGNIIMQSQPYPLSVNFNVFCQMTISPKVSVIESQSKSLFIGLGPQEIVTIIRHEFYFTLSDPTFTIFTCLHERLSQLHREVLI